MSKEILKDIIGNFEPEKFIRFFREKNSKFVPKKEILARYNDKNFRNGLKLGEIKFSSVERLVVNIFKVKQPLSEKSGKRAQYDKARDVLKREQKGTGIFIFYDEDGNFRFSLIYDIPHGNRRDWNNFRRFTYFVSSKQTNKTFLQRIGSGDFSSLKKVKNAFSVEKVTEDFYKDIANWYFWAVQKSEFPKDAEVEENGRNIAIIRLITRLIFIWFMHERGLVPNDLFQKQKMNDYLKDLTVEESTYYKAILQNLFFATLSTRQKERKYASEKRYFKGWNEDYGNQYVFRYQELFKNPDELKSYFGDIPFLNGGLFECLDDKRNGIIVDGFSRIKKNQPVVPNFLFFSDEQNVDLNTEYGTKKKKYKVRGLIDTLSSYNFTIDENDPNDAEVALDPELLGKVFENLLASFNPETSSTARKATGSYYTPREIVDYMVTQSLKEYFKTHLKDIKELDEKINQLFKNGDSENPFTGNVSKRIVALINNLRIVDPAVGSGAFLMGILNKLVFILGKLDPENKLWKEAQIEAVKNSVTDPALRRKLIDQVNEQFKNKNFDYGRKLYLIQKCIYGVDIQQIAVEIAKLRFFIALLVDEKIDKTQENWGIEPLPNLDLKIMQGNSLISEFMGINFDDGDTKKNNGQMFSDYQEVDELINKFQQKKNEFQNEPDKEKKEKFKEEIDDLMIKIFETKLEKQIPELKQIEKRAQGLPNLKYREKYIKEEKQRLSKKTGIDFKKAENQLREFSSKNKIKPFFVWKLYFAEVFQGNNPGFDIVIANPPYKEISKRDEKLFFQAKYKEVLSGHYDLFIFFFKKGIDLLKTGGINTYITPHTFTIYNQFQNLRKWLYNNSSIIEITDRIESIFKTAVVDNSISIIVKNVFNKKTKFSSYKYTGSELKLQTQVELEKSKYNFDTFDINVIQNKIILKKYEVGSSFLGDIVESSQGITVYAKVQGKKINYFRKKEESKNSRPYVRGREIFRYKLQWMKEYIEYGSWLWCSRDKKYFERPKIFLRQTAANIIATYIKEPFYCIDSVHSLIKKENGPDLKYILAILNSKLSNYLYHLLIAEEGKVFAQVKLTFLRKIPIKIVDDKAQKPFITLVDKILTITKTDDYLQNPVKKTKVHDYRKQIDKMVYKLYDLTPEEIKIVAEEAK